MVDYLVESQIKRLLSLDTYMINVLSSILKRCFVCSFCCCCWMLYVLNAASRTYRTYNINANTIFYMTMHSKSNINYIQFMLTMRELCIYCLLCMCMAIKRFILWTLKTDKHHSYNSSGKRSKFLLVRTIESIDLKFSILIGKFIKPNCQNFNNTLYWCCENGRWRYLDVSTKSSELFFGLFQTVRSWAFYCTLS